MVCSTTAVRCWTANSDTCERLVQLEPNVLGAVHLPHGNEAPGTAHGKHRARRVCISHLHQCLGRYAHRVASEDLLEDVAHRVFPIPPYAPGPKSCRHGEGEDPFRDEHQLIHGAAPVVSRVGVEDAELLDLSSQTVELGGQARSRRGGPVLLEPCGALHESVGRESSTRMASDASSLWSAISSSPE